MRIALISNRLPTAPPIGGAQRYVASLARRLAEQHDVLLLSGAPDPGLPGVVAVQTPHLRSLRPDESMPRKAIWHLRDQWMPEVHLALRRELRRFRPDVVHTHEPQGLSAAVFTATNATPAIHVHTAHDLNLLCVRTAMTVDGRFCGARCRSCRLQRAIRAPLAARRLARLIAPSDYVRDVHVRFGVVAPEAAVTIRQAAANAPSAVRRPRPGQLRIGFLGRLAPHKGVPTLLEVFARAPSGWTLEIAGAGLLERDVRQLVERDPRIRYHGHVENVAKDAFFELVDVLIVPSECEENAPLVAVEALVRGVPTIVSDRGGLPELPDAINFPAGDGEALLTALLAFAGDPDDAARRSERLIAQRERFLWPEHLARVAELYERALAESAT